MIQNKYTISDIPTNKFITPYEISDDLYNQFGYRYYPAEVRNMVKELGHDHQELPNKCRGYFLKT